MFETLTPPYNKNFPEYFSDYIRQISEAKKENKHHDHRRHLFINFLRNGFAIEPLEIDIEKKITVAKIRGRIDAFFKSVIFEFKTDIEKELPAAKFELKKYFGAQPNPNEYLAIVTDGLFFEIYQWEKGLIEKISSFKLSPETDPLEAFRNLDQFIFSSKPVTPTSSDIIKRFGLYSAVFNGSKILLQDMLDKVKGYSAVKIKIKEWNFLLAKVYGSELGDHSLFIRHNYLAILSRLLVAKTLFPRDNKTKSDYRGLLTGDYFNKKNLSNLVEPDFFSWAVDTEEEDDFIGFLIKLEKYLDVYSLKGMNEDILKALYQELVDPESRHLLGEYYTPDWLAELTLNIVGYKIGKFLDPACGSGTFIFKAIQCKREYGLKGNELLEDVLKTIIGIDVHPLAIMMTKANMLLALSEEIKKYNKDIYLQVYLADTLLVSEDVKKNCICIPVSSTEKFYIPIDTINRKINLGKLIDTVSDYAHLAAKEVKTSEAFKGLEAKVFADFDTREKNFWKLNFSLLTKLIKQKRNSIWPFILKNAYRPAFLRLEKVDYVVGNPPWLAYRYIKDIEYKKRVKELVFELSLLNKADVKLFTQMDTSTIFFKYCIREFLKPGGTIAFVMPKTTIIPAKQHVLFQTTGFSEIYDFSEVQPLFNVRSVVLVTKGKETLKSNIPITRFKGTLSYKNVQWKYAKRTLISEKDIYNFLDTTIKSQHYYSMFFQGATIVPRCFWFVQPASDSVVNLEASFLQTSDETYHESKKPWQVICRGRIEQEYLFETILAKGLLPFVVLRREIIFLPAKVDENKMVLEGIPQLLSEGKLHAAKWLQDVEKIWEERRSSEGRTLLQWLNYNNKLTNQNPKKQLIVLYNTSGTNLTAALFTPMKEREGFKISGFIADAKTYYYYPKNVEEGDYLCAMLNSDIVNKLIKAYQPEGLYGERDIHRRPFEVCPIPDFNQEDHEHMRLVELGKECRQLMEGKSSQINGRLGMVRLMVKSLLAAQLSEINKIVIDIFQSQGQTMLSLDFKKKKVAQPRLFDI